MAAYALVCAAAASGAIWLRGRAMALLPLTAFASGLAWKTELELRRPPASLEELASGDRPLLRLVGTLEGTALFLDEASEPSWVVSLEMARGPRATIPLRGRFRLNVTGTADDLLPGDRIEALGRWRRPLPPSNPHEAARDRREFRREIWGSLECAPGCIARLERPAFSLRAWLHRLRAAALQTLRERFPAQGASIAAPLLLGIWPKQSQDEIDLFRKTGAIHLLAVSGMHVSLLFGGAAMLAFRRSRRRKLLAGFLAAFLFFYAALTGFQPPVLRSCLMLWLASIAWAKQRPADAMSALGASAAIVAWLFPAELEGPSFQLSFVASAGIILFGPPIANRLRSGFPSNWGKSRLGNGIARSLGASLGAFGTSLGVVALHFRVLPQASIPATLLATPFLAPLMLLGYAALLLPSAAARACVWGFECLQEGTIAGLRACELAFGDPIPLCGTPWFLAASASLGFLLFVAGSRKIGFAVALAGGLGILLFAAPTREELRIDILDVGHGNGVVLRLPDGSCLLFDAGSSSRRDLARSVLLPFLDGEGIREIDTLLVSHGDADHWNALPSLWGSVSVRRIFCGEGASRPLGAFLPAESDRAMMDLSGPLQWSQAGARFLLWRASPEQCLSENDGSLCLLVRYAGRSILLCGDLEEPGIRALLESGQDWSCDFLLLPHHGLPAEGLDELLDRASPELAIASCGRRFRGEGLAPKGWEGKFLATSKAGAIRVKIAENGGCSLESFAGPGMMAGR